MNQTKIISLLLIICFFEICAATDFEIAREKSLEIKNRFLGVDSRAASNNNVMLFSYLLSKDGKVQYGYMNYCGSRNCVMTPKNNKQEDKNFKFELRYHPTIKPKPGQILVQIATYDNMCLTTKFFAKEDDQLYFTDCYDPSAPRSLNHSQFIIIERYEKISLNQFTFGSRLITNSLTNDNFYIQYDNDNLFELEPLSELNYQDGLGVFFVLNVNF